MLVAVLVGPSVAGGPMRDGWSAMLFYVVAYGVMNLGAFGVLAFLRVQDRPAEELNDFAGLARQHPLVAATLAICLFSLMGMPPTVGFLGKVFIFTGALSLGDDNPHRVAMIVLAVIGVLNAAVGAAYYLRVIGAVYQREPREVPKLSADRPLRVGLALCCGFVLLAGLWPRELVRQASNAAADLRSSAAVVMGRAIRSPGSAGLEHLLPGDDAALVHRLSHEQR
jgi:NADH-quinone oxidoreductase subunit N